jgi:hypothetical protein
MIDMATPSSTDMIDADDPAPMRRTKLVKGKQEEDAMLNWQVGAVKITCVVEMLIPFPYDPAGFFLRDATPEALKARPWLYPHFANEDGSLNVSVQALLVEAPGCSPNGRTSRSWSSAPTMPRRQLDT